MFEHERSLEGKRLVLITGLMVKCRVLALEATFSGFTEVRVGGDLPFSARGASAVRSSAWSKRQTRDAYLSIT